MACMQLQKRVDEKLIHLLPILTGWGKIQHPGTMHHLLQQGKLPVVSEQACTNLNSVASGLQVSDRSVDIKVLTFFNF